MRKILALTLALAAAASAAQAQPAFRAASSGTTADLASTTKPRRLPLPCLLASALLAALAGCATAPAGDAALARRLTWTRDMFEDGQTDWARMKAGFERIVKDHPDPWNVNNFARFACHAGDLQTAARLAAVIGDKPMAAAWYNDARYRERCRARAAQAVRK